MKRFVLMVFVLGALGMNVAAYDDWDSVDLGLGYQFDILTYDDQIYSEEYQYLGNAGIVMMRIPFFYNWGMVINGSYGGMAKVTKGKRVYRLADFDESLGTFECLMGVSKKWPFLTRLALVLDLGITIQYDSWNYSGWDDYSQYDVKEETFFLGFGGGLGLQLYFFGVSEGGFYLEAGVRGSLNTLLTRTYTVNGYAEEYDESGTKWFLGAPALMLGYSF